MGVQGSAEIDLNVDYRVVFQRFDKVGGGVVIESRV